MIKVKINHQIVDFSSSAIHTQATFNGRTYEIFSKPVDDRIKLSRRWKKSEIITAIALTLIGIIPGIIVGAIYGYRNRAKTYSIITPNDSKSPSSPTNLDPALPSEESNPSLTTQSISTSTNLDEVFPDLSDRKLTKPVIKKSVDEVTIQKKVEDNTCQNTWFPFCITLDTHKMCRHLKIQNGLSFLLNNNFSVEFNGESFLLQQQQGVWDPQEALKVCRDFLFYANNWAKEKDSSILIREVYQIAVKPILSYIQMHNEDLIIECGKLKMQFLNDQRLFEKRQKQKPFTQEEGATCLQRAYRTHLYLKNKTSPQIDGDKVYSVPLNITPPPPKRSNAIDPEASEEWILSHEIQWQPTARKFIKNLRHRSFKKFEQRLKASVESFNEKLMSLPVEERKYIIMIPKESKKKSNPWVTSLALKYLAIPPLDIVYEEQNAFPKDIKVVAFDDAAYSGRQFGQFCSRCAYNNINIYAIIPFITRYAMWDLSSAVWISSHEKMLSIPDLNEFSDEELKLLEKITVSFYEGQLEKRTLYWFDHKIPDALSTLQDVLSEGLTLDGSGKKIPFIPKTNSPYFTHPDHWF